MSSPPTSNTSTKAAHLHNDHGRSSSFPPLATLNPFRKKSLHKPARSPSPIEPYEVAPGIWNTDATAKVFGYLEPEAKKERPKGQILALGIRHESPIPKRKPVVRTKLPDLANEVGNDELNNSIPSRTPKLSVQIPHPLREGHVDRIEDRYQNKVELEKMRTVSRDDQLIQRGANPRTGLVSPLVVSDNSDDNAGHDYVFVGKTQSGRPWPKSRTRSGKWRQDGIGWSLVESPLLSPIAQSSAEPISRRVSCKQLEDKLLVQMPGVDNPEPDNMTDQQMRRYQESVAQACRDVGTTAMVDPNTVPPSPRPSSPEGPSTPPNKLQRIRRKMVGSGPSGKVGSNDTVIVADKRASSMPTPRRNSKQMQRDRIVTPSNTPKGSSWAPHSDKSVDITRDPFLGQKNTASGTHFPSLRTTQRQEAHEQLPAAHQQQSEAQCVENPATPTLSQYLPRLQFLHPSHFANLETSSYRRPAQLLPPRLRPLEQQRKTIEDACTITTTSTLSPKAEKEYRPKVRRLDSSIAVPRAKERLQTEAATLRKNVLREGTSTKKHSSAIKLTVVTSDPTTATPTAPIAAIQPQISAGSERHPKATLAGAEQGARSAMLENHRRHQLKHGQTRKFSGADSAMPGLTLGSANITRDPARTDPRNGAGITPMCAPHGDNGRDWGYLNLQQEKEAEVRDQYDQKPSTPDNVAFKNGCGAWFAGQWAESPRDHGGPSLRHKELPARRRSILITVADARLWVPGMDGSLHAWARLQCVQERMHQMACHIAQTLHPDSSAIKIMGTPNLRAWDYLRAAKDLVLACVYLLLFLNVLLAVKKVLVLMAWVLYWLWHPVRMFIAVVKLCVLA